MILFGYGLTNRAIAKRFPGQCTIYDDAFTEESEDEFGNELLPSDCFKSVRGETEVVTPGIPPNNPLIQNASNPISDYDYFYASMPYTVWVSGTNGKTTTTGMIAHLLEHRGCVAGGNIGNPVAALDSEKTMWALETSSFTLHYTCKAKPGMYVLLPIREDHISWHGDFEAYEAAKLSVLQRMEEGEAILLPKKYAGLPTHGFKIPYEDSADLADYFGFDLSKIAFKEPFLLDAVLALSVSKILYDEVDYVRLNGFQVGEHKLEEFMDRQGRLWVDDSKATNVDATIEAAKSYVNRPIHLILGGDDKGMDLVPLFEVLQALPVTLYANGANESKLLGLAREWNVSAESCGTLEGAVKRIAEVHSQESVAILSPSAASFDQFSSYKDRGERFKQFVRELS